MVLFLKDKKEIIMYLFKNFFLEIDNYGLSIVFYGLKNFIGVRINLVFSVYVFIILFILYLRLIKLSLVRFNFVFVTVLEFIGKLIFFDIKI